MMMCEKYDMKTWLDKLIEAHQYLVKLQVYNEKVDCYTLQNKDMPISNLESVCNELGLPYTYKPVGKEGQYPQYKHEVVCNYKGYNLYELIRNEEYK